MREIYLLGVGDSSFARIDLANACGFVVKGLYHYNSERTGQVDHGYPIIGSFDDLFKQDINGRYFLLTMGDMTIRKDLMETIIAKGGIIPTLIHPSAEVSQFAQISDIGVIVDSQVIIQADCVISEGVFICSQSIVCHGTKVAPHVFIAPKALLGARLKINDFVFIGQNSTLISTKVKEIGRNAIVGAGAVVTKPVEEGCVVVGNPARPISYKI